ncbi:AraC family transcriptional regulator [Nocardia mexicana]|nr:AraC family transcriptional regulator [Nocardia mexicana]
MGYEVFEVALGDDLPAVDRIDMWRAHVGGNQGTADAEIGSPQDFSGHTWTQRALSGRDNDPGQLQLVEFASTAIVYDRSDEAAKSDCDDSARLVIPLDGQIRLCQSGHEVCVGPGRMGVLRWGQAMVMSHGDGFRGYIFNIPSYVLPPAGDPRGRLGLRPHNAILRTVRGMADNLAVDRHALSGAEFVAIGRSMVDLVAGTLDVRRAPELDGYARLAAQARRRIRLYHSDPMMTVETLAESLGCSKRHLETAMKKALGRSPGAELRETRLLRAFDMLSDPDNTEVVVGVAALCGYNSVSGFRESFVRRFGVQPGELQLQARSDR